MENRKYARTSLISDYNTEFKLGGQSYANVHVSNIGTRGCCVQMPVGSAKYLKDRPLLENMILLHADAKKYSLRGRVAWFDDGRQSKGDWIAAGVEFLDTPEECSKEIADYLKATSRH